jgi:hypothetical protein
MDGLSTRFVALLEDMRFITSFYSSVPSRLGHNETVDCAARAVTQAYHCGQFKRALSEEYIKAVKGLRNSLDASDNSLIVIMLLILFERIVGDEPKNALTHLSGITALLQSRSSTNATTEIMSAVLYDNKSITHWIPLQRKGISPFENE